MELKIMVAMLVLTRKVLLAVAALTCSAGQYVDVDDNGQVFCNSCPDKEYMPDLNHQNTQCYRCTKPEEWRHEVEEQACTKTSNTVIVCTVHYYRANGECNPCTECGTGDAVNRRYTARPCGKYNDRFCCEKPTDMYDHGSNGCKDGGGDPLTTPATTTKMPSSAEARNGMTVSLTFSVCLLLTHLLFL